MANLEMDWKKYYREHLISMEEAAQKIVPGDGLWLGQASQLPYKFLDVMYAHREEYNYHNINILWNCANMPFDMLFDPDVKKHFTLSSIFCLPLERMSGGMGVMDYAGGSYDFTEEWAFANGANVFACHICPPDEDGYCNFGAYGISNGKAMASDPRTKKRFAFIDHNQFPIPGDRDKVSMHISEFEYIVEDDQEFMPIPAAPPSAVDKKIASYILPYIHEGDKVEIGFGGLGEEILANLKSIGNLEVFSEVACDNMAQLVEEGVLTKVVAASPGACSERFFDFVATNPKARLYPSNEIIRMWKVMEQENIVAINATFMVDLLGQACSEAQGLVPYSGSGGSFAFIYGAINAPGGRSFVVLRSTYTDKQGVLRSNIVPWLPEKCIVSLPKNYQMYIVTEYGIANVFLKSLKDRIREIIKIAHPQFRKELKESILTTPLITEEDFSGELNEFINNPPDANETFAD